MLKVSMVKQAQVDIEAKTLIAQASLGDSVFASI
jgi:hypothetical protein